MQKMKVEANKSLEILGSHTDESLHTAQEGKNYFHQLLLHNA